MNKYASHIWKFVWVQTDFTGIKENWKTSKISYDKKIFSIISIYRTCANIWTRPYCVPNDMSTPSTLPYPVPRNKKKKKKQQQQNEKKQQKNKKKNKTKKQQQQFFVPSLQTTR